MGESAREFFEGMGSRIGGLRLEGTTASYRFDIDGAGSWRLELRDGEPVLTESSEGADCVIGASEKHFMRIVHGEQNPMTAFMTGKLRIEGDMSLALKLKELFSGSS